MMTPTIKEDIKSIRKDIDYIKKNMVDVDSIMTEEDYKALLDYRADKKKDKLVSESQLKIKKRIIMLKKFKEFTKHSEIREEDALFLGKKVNAKAAKKHK